jgi:hypothetical protein
LPWGEALWCGRLCRILHPLRNSPFMLSRIIRLEADVKHSLAKPKTISEALDELEGKVGRDGRRKFEKFLREVAELDDEGENMIDLESKQC